MPLLVVSQQISMPNFCFKNFDIQDGFPEKYIYSTTQDATGQMWFGTATGLYTYDNRFFKKVEPDFTIPNRNINNLLQTVYYDSVTKKIWCASYKCLLWFDPLTKKFSSPDYKLPQIQKLADDFILSFCRDKKGVMWIGTANSDWCTYNSITNEVNYYQPDKNKHIAATKIIQTPDNRIWVSTSNGLYETSAGKNNIKKYTTPPNNREGNFLNTMVYDTYWNCLWIASGGEGIMQFDLATNKFTQHILPVYANNKKVGNGVVYGIGIINKDWLVLDASTYFYIPLRKRVFSNTEINSVYNFRFPKLVSSFTDAEKNVWLCTHNGLSVLPWQNRYVVNASFTSPSGITHGFEKMLALNENELLVQRNTNPSLLVVNTTSKESRYFELFKNKISNAIQRYSANEILIAVENELYKYNTLTHDIKKIVQHEAGAINSILVSPPKEIFIAEEGKGICKVSPNDGVVSVVSNTNLQEELKPVAIDAKENIWYFVDNKLYYYDIKIKNSFSVNKIIPSKFIDNLIIPDVKSDINGNIWFTTKGSGVYFINCNSRNYSYKNFSSQTQNDIISDFASTIVSDSVGNLWIGFLDGLAKWNPTTQTQIVKLNEQYGLYTNGLEPQDYLPQYNKLYTGTWSEATSISLSQLGKNTYRNSIIFSDINIGGKKFSTMPEYIELPYNKAFFSFNAGTTGYNNGNQNKVVYKLQGIDNTWNTLGINYNINYTGLNNGSYILYLKSASNENLFGNAYKIKIKITPPFYKTWWFLLLFLLSIASLFFYFYKLRLAHARKQASLSAEFKQRLSETEMKALRAQMNPHFIFNTLNSINKFILQKDTLSASQYLTKFSKLIRLILDESNEKKVTLYSEIELLNLYLEMERLRFDKKFSYIINTSPVLNSAEILLPSMLIQPYIENAIWHGLLHLPEEKQTTAFIRIDIQPENQKLKITIEDNGVGRKKATELKSKTTLMKKSYGMQLTQNRIEIINNIQKIDASVNTIDLYDVQQNAIGTKVVILLPLEHYKQI